MRMIQSVLKECPKNIGIGVVILVKIRMIKARNSLHAQLCTFHTFYFSHMTKSLIRDTLLSLIWKKMKVVKTPQWSRPLRLSCWWWWIASQVMVGVISFHKICIPDICHFFYTNTFLDKKILHSKVRKFAKKIALRQNSVNFWQKLPRDKMAQIVCKMMTHCV